MSFGGIGMPLALIAFGSLMVVAIILILAWMDKNGD